MFPKSMKSKGKLFISIQTKLLLVFLSVTISIFGVNMFIYVNINEMIENISKVYESNAMLNEMQNSLSQIHRNMEIFLDTRDTEAGDEYLRSEQEYLRQLNSFQAGVFSDSGRIAERNIYNMSRRYLEIADKAMEAKKIRSVSEYKNYYEDARELFGYVNSYLYSLNNQQFQNNSNNYQTLFLALKYSETSNLLILGLVSVLSVVLINLLTRSITNPLRRLAETAGEVAKGTLDIELSGTGENDEVGIVTSAFNQMVGSLKDYIEQIKNSMELESAMKEKQLLMEAHLKDAQIKYLQAQINPHFLFNTLNAGAQLAMMEGADRTYQYVQNVADFFRYNVRKNNDVVMLWEEIKLVDHYMYIINVRFSGEIHFEKSIDEEMIHVQVPSMILQPLVENCINHGLRGVEWEKSIELSVYREEDRICVSVRDNGRGISQEKIQRIMHSRLRETGPKDTERGVGLDNVINRMRLFFGREDVVEIISAGENMGTEVAIYIPLED